MFFVGYVTSWIFGPHDGPLNPIEEQWNNWDAVWYRGIAEGGYEPPNTGFFPLLPIAMRVLGPVLGGPTFAALALNLVLGCVAAVLVSRLARTWGFPGHWAVIALATAPTTVFLSAPYPEAMFLVAGMGAWLAALRGQFLAMGLLASVACLARVNGIFLIPALALLLVVQRVRLRAYAALLLPLATLLAYMAYMRTFRGNWFEWRVAQQENWNRELVGPIETFRKSWTAAIRNSTDPDFTWFSYNEMFIARLEILAAGVFVGAVIALLVMRRWPEALYVGLNAGALLTTTNYASLPRYLLVAWPVVLLVGLLLARYSWAKWAWASFIVPLAVLLAASFTYGQWSG